jgi:DNA-binding SARP family transcriptional activator
MWIGLLGPMEVRNSSGIVDITAPKLRSMLAALAVRAGNVVPMEALAEAVWDGDWPAKWQVTLRNNVKQLRMKLASPDRDRLAWRSPGYCLSLDPDESDLARFESLRKDGLAAANCRDWAEASRLLTRAASLWRGSALADIESRLLRDEHVHYLERQRLVVLEARIEADIRLSRRGSAAMVPELERLLEAYPERERFHMLTMVALYRAGRQAEALSLHQKALKVITDIQGVSPGPDLPRLHEQILLAAPALLAEPLMDQSLF